MKNIIYNKLDSLKELRKKKIQTIQDVTNIDELNELIGDDEISEEEYQDMVSYIQNKNRNKLKE
tara:strand:- start:208 stop:399 length:192 start_codon:yes stop_codon:yes gene_type:complete